MNLFMKLRSAWRFATWTHWPEPCEWADTDRKVWSAFLSSETGKRLTRRIANNIIASNAEVVSSVNGKVNLDYRAGDANGFRRCACYLEALGAVEDDAETAESSTEDSGFRAS